jgi:hypothetical protein
MPARLPACAVLAALAVAAGGCLGGGDEAGGGGERADRAAAAQDDPRPPAEAPEPSPDAVPSPDVRPEAGAEDVIRAWADTLRRGDVKGASAYFALPSTVSNGTPPIKLETRAEVEFFNSTLPCGAVVIATEDAPHGFVIATFRLTERPGRGRCGAGTGATARTALLVRDGHITDWLRVPDDGSSPAPDTTPA